MRLSKEILIDYENLCDICYEPLLEKWVLPSCGVHEFCKKCFVQHVESLIKDSKVTHILCPGKDCQIEFDENDVKEIVSEENFVKYIKFKERAALMIDPSVKWCSQPNCEGYVRGSNEDKKLSCPKCGFELCFQCGKAWHPKKTCEQIIDEDYELWAKGKEIQLCPKCKHKIEKFDGCNHMTCASCNYNWCWLCRGHYTSNHYNKLNPLGCPNLQSGYNSRQSWPMWKIYLARCRGLCLWLLIIIFLPLIIVFGPALYATLGFYRDIKRKSCIFISCMLILVFLGITIITPPGYVIAIPVLVFVGIRKCCKKCKSCF